LMANQNNTAGTAVIHERSGKTLATKERGIVLD
jgi:hypothetical protein